MKIMSFSKLMVFFNNFQKFYTILVYAKNMPFVKAEDNAKII